MIKRCHLSETDASFYDGNREAEPRRGGVGCHGLCSVVTAPLEVWVSCVFDQPQAEERASFELGSQKKDRWPIWFLSTNTLS